MTDAKQLTLALRGKWHGRYGVAPCPICQPEARRDQNALALADGGNGLLAHCKKSDCAFADILAAAGIAHCSYTHPDPTILAQRKAERLKESEKRAAQTMRLWQEARPIAGTLAERCLRDARGITWEQAQRLDRESRSEPVGMDGDLSKKAATLRECDLSQDAIDFLITDAKRVEMNALRPAEFLDTLRAGIEAHAPVKVMPCSDTLNRAYVEMALRKKLQATEARLRAEPEPIMPPEIMDTLRTEMQRKPSLSWDQVLFQLAGGERE